METEKLIREAFQARRMAYTPYSHFQVGAALLTKEGRIYAAIAIVGGAEDAGQLDYCAPCGVCRQVMMEFCEPATFTIILAKSEHEYCIYKLEELFPMGFGPKNLEENI